MQKFGSSVTSSSKSAFSKLGGLAKLAIGGAIAKQVFDFGADAVHAAEEAKAANDKSLKQIQSDADKVGLSFEGLTKFSENFGDSIGTDDEAITSLAAKITQSFDLKKLGLDSNKGLESLTKNILEFSSATGKSQTATTKLFQSIANDPKASLTTLLKLVSSRRSRPTTSGRWRTTGRPHRFRRTCWRHRPRSTPEQQRQQPLHPRS